MNASCSIVACYRLNGCVETIDLDGLLDDFVPADEQSVAWEDLIIRRHFTPLLDGFEIDFVDLGGFSVPFRANQGDLLWVCCR